MRLQTTEAELNALRQSIAAPQVSWLEAMTAQALVRHEAPEVPQPVECYHHATLQWSLTSAASCLASAP